MEFPIKFDTVKSGWFIVYIEGSHVIISKQVSYISFSEDYYCVLHVANSADPRKCRKMWNFIWLFTVCHSTRVGVYGP